MLNIAPDGARTDKKKVSVSVRYCGGSAEAECIRFTSAPRGRL